MLLPVFASVSDLIRALAVLITHFYRLKYYVMSAMIDILILQILYGLLLN